MAISAKWIIRQNKLEGYDDKVKGWFTMSKRGDNWSGSRSSWGNFRIPIEPADKTNTQGRHSMFLHGGDEPGSAGCIDLTHNIDEFISYFAEYEQDMMIIVKYPENKW